MPISEVLVLPTISSPADFSRCTSSLSRFGANPWKKRQALLVQIPPSTASMSLSRNGTPRKGPSGRAPRACCRARSYERATTAFRGGLRASTRSMAASTSSDGDTCLRRTSAARSVASSRSYSGREGMASPCRDRGPFFPEDARAAVAQGDPLSRAQSEDAVRQAPARHFGQKPPPGRAVVRAAAVVRLEVDGHHRLGVDVAEDVQRLLRAGMAPPVFGPASPRRRDGDEREVDAGEPRADLAEHARVVA